MYSKRRLGEFNILALISQSDIPVLFLHNNPRRLFCIYFFQSPCYQVCMNLPLNALGDMAIPSSEQFRI